MIIRYLENGVLKTLDVVVTQGAEHEEEMMKSDFIRLSWLDSVYRKFPVDAYIIPFADGVRYSLLEPYEPEKTAEDTYKYEPQFQHPKMYLGKIPFVQNSYDSSSNPITLLEWQYSGFVTTLLEKFCSEINSVFGFSGDDAFSYAIEGEIEDIVTAQFVAQDILSALANICNVLECEYHIDWTDRLLRFGHIKFDRSELTTPLLEVGSNIGVPSARDSKEGFWNAYQPQGSTRNMSVRAASGENVQSNVRLALDRTTYPDGIIYTDGAGNIITKAQFEAKGFRAYIKTPIYDKVYPKLDLYVYNVRGRERYLLDDDGNKVIDHYNGNTPVYKRYTIWYMRLAYPTYNAQGEVTAWTDYAINTEQQVIDGKTLMGAFQPNTKEGAQTSPLAGRGEGEDGYYGFELNYIETQEEANSLSAEPTYDEHGNIDDSGVSVLVGDYEIVYQQNEDYILPTTASQGIVPKGLSNPSLLGNIVNLYNIVMDSSYTESAQNELENETLKTIARDVEDNNSYSFKSYEEAFNASNPGLYIGRKVIYKNGDYQLETRVMKLVTKLDYDFQQEITVGNEILKGNQTTMREQIETILSGQGGGGGGVSESALKRIIQNWVSPRFLSKLNDDTANGFIRFMQGLQVGGQFVSGLLGEGGVFRKEADGTTYLEADKMYIRMKAYFDTVEIREYQHSAGNRVASVAGNKCVRVEWYNSSNEVLEQTQANLSSVAYFRCYFRASDGEDTVRNNFVIGDQIYCHITSVNGSTDNPNEKGLNQKHYWRLCIGRNTEGILTDDGEAYIDVSNRSSETLTISGTSYTHAGYQTGSDIPEPQDSMIQLGNINDVARQGAIIEFVTGANAPSYQIYQGINDFSLNNKNYVALGYDTSTGRAYMNVYGDFRFGSRDDNGSFIKYNAGNGQLDIKAKINAQSTIGNSSLSQFVKDNQNNYDDSDLVEAIGDLQNQIDGAIDTWFYDYMPVATDASGAPANRVPLTNKEPYKTWYEADTSVTPAVTTERDKHLGDIFYDNKSGYAFRFSWDEDNSVFQWVEITDSAVIKALNDAANAQETADHKRRVFTVTPYPPYEVGDLWAQGANGDLMKCKTAKTASQSYSASDWDKASKYTDDSAFNGYINAILNGSGSSGDAAVVAAAQKAIKDALGGGTEVDGGLLLTSLIAMRKYNESTQQYKTWAGISGTFQDAETGTGYKGHGIAAWYGGAMVDKEVSTSATDYAKSLFRFDGSGYLAGGNITWDKNGIVTIANVYANIGGSSDVSLTGTLQTLTNLSNALPLSIQSSVTYLDPQYSFTNLSVLGKSVATQEWVNNHYISISFFETLFNALNASGNKVSANTTTGIASIKAMFGFWTEQYLSALGQGNDGGSSATTLAALNDVTISGLADGQMLVYDLSTNHWKNQNVTLVTALANLTDVTLTSLAADQFLKYDGTKWVNASISAYNLPVASSGTLGGIKIGYDGTTAKTYAVQLDSNNRAYVNVPWSDTTYTLPTASSTTKGGVKVGSTLAISSEVLNLATSGVTAGTYRSVTVDTYGRVTAGSNPTTIAGYGITDAKIANGVITLGANTITPLTSHQTLYTLSVYGGTTKVLDFKPNANASLYIKAGGDISLTNDTTNKYITLSYSHPTGGANTTISAANGKVLSAITVNNLGHVTSVSSKTLAAADIPSLNYLPLTGGTLTGNLKVNSVNGSYVEIGAIRIVYDSTNNALKVVKSDGTSAANFYATGGLAALGETSDGQAGVGDVTWALLADSTDTRQIAISHLNGTSGVLDILTGYTTSGKNYKVQKDASGHLYVNVPWQAGSGTVTSVKVGSTSYSPTDGVISLPAYPTVPTKVSQLTNDSGYITSYTDTKNTAGSTDTSSKIFLIGATSQAANPQTYSHDTAYVGTDGCLYSGGAKVLTSYTDTNTWRKVQLNGTDKLGTGTGTNPLNFKAGSNVSITESSGTFTFAATDTTYSSKAAASGGTDVSLVTTGEKYTWNSKAAGNHTHTTSLAASTGTNQLTLAFGSKYALTAGGTSYIFTMPSNPNTNTWRGIYTGGTSRIGNGIDTKAVNFIAGSNVNIYYEAAGTGDGQSGSADYFNVKIGAYFTNATQSAAGLMSGDDKKKLDGIAANANNYSLPLAASGTRGGVKIGFESAGKNYAVQLSSEKMYVYVPWTDHYDWSDITNKPLTLTKNTTGFSISGGTTSKTLTVGADYTLGAACSRGVTDNSANADVTSTDTNLITGRTLYYQLAKKGYTTNTGTVTSVATGTGLTGGTITTTGTISINSTYQTYISNGNTAYGWGNHANAGYLLKSGGTMTGTLNLTDGIGIESTSGGLLVCKPTNWTAITSSQWGVGAAIQGVIRSNDSALIHARINGSTISYYDIIDTKGGQTISDSLQVASVCIEHTNEINATGSNNLYLQYRNTGNLSLCMNGYSVGIGTSTPAHKLEVEGNIATSASNGAFVQIGAIRLVYDSTNDALKVVKSNGGSANFYATGGLSALGAGTDSSLDLSVYLRGNERSSYSADSQYNFGYFEISSGSGVPSSSQYGSLLVMPYRTISNNSSVDFATQIFLPNGDDGSYPNSMFYRTGLSSSWNSWQRVQNVSMSDIRLKTVLESDCNNVCVEVVANAPVIKFLWKKGYGDKKQHIGSIAQYWQKYLPLAVEEENGGYFSMQYGVIALLASIATAKKVVDHEKRISDLEKENEILKEQVEQLKAA